MPNRGEGVDKDKPIVVLVHDALVNDFREWLTQRGLELRKAPYSVKENDPRTYLVTPTNEALRQRHLE